MISSAPYLYISMDIEGLLFACLEFLFAGCDCYGFDTCLSAQLEKTSANPRGCCEDQNYLTRLGMANKVQQLISSQPHLRYRCKLLQSEVSRNGYQMMLVNSYILGISTTWK